MQGQWYLGVCKSRGPQGLGLFHNQPMHPQNGVFSTAMKRRISITQCLNIWTYAEAKEGETQKKQSLPNSLTPCPEP